MEDREVARRFVQGSRKGKGNNIHIEGDIIYVSEYGLPIAKRWNQNGIDYLLDNCNWDNFEIQKNVIDVVIKELKGTVLYIIDCAFVTKDCGCKTCNGNNAKHQLGVNNKLIKELKFDSKGIKNKAISRKFKKKIVWLQEQNELLKPIALVNEL